MFYNFAYEVCLGFPNVCKVALSGDAVVHQSKKKVLHRRIYRQVVVMYLQSMK